MPNLVSTKSYPEVRKENASNEEEEMETTK
jgi:hypothetical protein